MRALKCDRCGAFYDYDYSGRKFGLSDFTRDLTERDPVVDLCPKCQLQAEEFLQEFLKRPKDPLEFIIPADPFETFEKESKKQ